uniref:RNA-dependent RNA polymerase n=1 Tax=Riboviria sp. TaxID=2585031 RepID=A0A8K1MZI9_9VIRU|nr:MAG: RNA-dependent RNA polymerase [Riboviria sp.]
MEKVGELDMNVATILSRDHRLSALVRIAKEISLGKAQLQDYVARCAFHGLTLEDSHEYAAGTIVYAQALKRLREAELEYAREGPEFDYIKEGGDVAQGSAPRPSEPKQVAQLARLPPAMKHDHAQQQQYAWIKGLSLEHHAYPELNEEWEEFFQQWLANPELKVKPNKSEHFQITTTPLGYKTVRVLHEEYGWAGLAHNRTKKDCDVTQEPTPYFQKSTHSTAVCPHHELFLPRYNRHSRRNAAHGLVQRMNRDPTRASTNLDEMKKYIQQAVQLVIRDLEAAGLRIFEGDITPRMFFQWLATRKFPATKKIKYLEQVRPFVVDENTWVHPQSFPIDPGAFMKNEWLAAGNKGPRMILPGPYAMTGVMGPLVDMIGDYFFSMPYTSKKIPEVERAMVALRRFGLAAVILNDMSAYECSITAEHQRLIEHAIFKHFFPRAGPWVDRYLERIKISQKGYNASLPSLRRSGDPQTSLGNSITNIVSIIAAALYVIDKHNCGPVKPTAWVEGDDSLVAWPAEWGNAHDSANPYFNTYHEAFVKMGFDTKMEICSFAGDAGYCSMFFTEAGKNSPSVASTFIDFPYDHNNTGQGVELLAMKSQSLVAQAPGQPLTWALAQYYNPPTPLHLRLPYNAYEYEEYIRQGFEVILSQSAMVVTLYPKPIPQPSEADRLLFQGRYGFTPIEQQDIERRILEKGLLGVTHYELRQLCVEDGIDIDCCAVFYARNVERSDVYPKPDNEPYVCHFEHDENTGSWKMTKTERLPDPEARMHVAQRVHPKLRNPVCRAEKEVKLRRYVHQQMKENHDARTAQVYRDHEALVAAIAKFYSVTGLWRRRLSAEPPDSGGLAL